MSVENSNGSDPVTRSNPVHEHESEWLFNARKGDSSAFTSLVEVYQKPVYNLCYRMLGNALDAEDAAQETFLRAYLSLQRYDPSRPFSTWLLSIAAHYCIDQIRKRRMKIVAIEELPVPDLPEPSPGIEANLSLTEERRRIRAVLNCLEATDRAAVIMYYWYDFSYEEICQALSITMSALKSRLHRARRSMAAEWQSQQNASTPVDSPRVSPSGKLMTERLAS